MSAVLTAVRERYPAYASVADDELIRALGAKHPIYREQDEEFAAEYDRAVATGPLKGPEARTLPTVADTTGGGARAPLASPGEMAASLGDVPREFWENINTPTVELAQPLTPDERQQLASEPTGTRVAAGVYESLAHTANFFTSPMGIATLGIGALPRTAQRLIAALFATQMASTVPETAAQLGEELGKPPAERDWTKVAELITTGATTLGFTTLAGKHALTTDRAAAVSAIAKMLKAEPDVMPKPVAAQVRTGEPAPAPADFYQDQGGASVPARRPEVTPAPGAAIKPTENVPAAARPSDVARSAEAPASAPPEQSLPVAPVAVASPRASSPESPAAVRPVDPVAAASTVPKAEAAKQPAKKLTKKEERERFDAEAQAVEETASAAPDLNEWTRERVSRLVESRDLAKQPSGGYLGTSLVGRAFIEGVNRARTGQVIKRGIAAAAQMQEAAHQKMVASLTNPVETPAAAVAKVADHIAEVKADEPITRAAKYQPGDKLSLTPKEIKSELVQRLEAALKKAPTEEDFNAKRPAPVSQNQAWEAKNKVTIDIPGDGTFTVWNHKTAIGQVLKDARRLSTTSTSSGNVTVTELAGHRARMDRIVRDATQVYGARRAVKVLRAQAENPDLELDAKQRENLRDAADEMEGQFPEVLLRQRIQETTDKLTDLREVLEMQQDKLPQLKKDRDAAAAEYDSRKAAGKGTAKAYEKFRAGERLVTETEVDIKQRGESIKRNTELLAAQQQKLRAIETEINGQPATEQATAQAAEGFQGMGGAVPAEFKPSGGTPTSIKNATVDVERARRGLPPAMQPAARDFQTVWDEAMALVDVAPETQDRLIESLRREPRAVTDLEDALLLQRQIDLQNEYGKATRELAAAYDDAQRFPDRLEAVERHKAQAQSLSDRLLELYDLNKAVGTATARGLNARKLLANEDFTLAKMELEMRAAKDGAPLTEVERLELAALQDKIAKTQAAFDDYVAKAEAEKANRRVDETIKELQDELKRRPNYDPRIVKVAEEIVQKLEKAAVSASQRLKEKFARTNTGLDPTIIYDLGVVGAAKIARGGLDFARFGAAMLAEFGDGIKPYLQAAWEKANLHLENEGAKYGDKAPQVKQLLRKRDAMGKRENVIAGLKQGKAEEIPVTMQGDYIRKLAEGFVAAGIRTRDALVDAVHEVLTKEVGLDLTRRETMDAISGYGKYKPLNPDAIKATLRDLKQQLQQVAKLEDIQARRPLAKTGVERQPFSDEGRRLTQQVNEAKRRFGVVVTDPARQLKSALDAVKKRLKNQIADLEYQINTKERIVKTRTPSPFDAESKLLELRRDELRRQFDEIFPARELTDAQRLALAQKNIERSIADYEQRIAAGDVAVRERKPGITSPQLEALKARRDGLRAEWEALRDAADPGRAERAALSALKSRLKTATAEYQDRIARGDFTKRRVRELNLDREALSLKAENEKWKQEYQRRLITERLKQRSTGRKIYDAAKEAVNLPRNILSSWDVSAVLRQGGFIAVGNPARAARSLGPMFRALASDRQARIIEQEILSRDNAGLYRRSKLYLAPHDAVHLAAMEEQIMARFSKYVPGVRASNRAYITFLNKLRADSFDALKESIESRGTPLNAAELEAIANYINVATGRGNLYKFTPAAETLATVFFSPRLMASRFQLVAGQPFYHGSARTRAAVAGEYAKFLAGMAVIYTLGSLAGAKIGNDRRSADFGKLILGNTRIDPLAGLSQTSVLLSRLQTGETVGQSGQVKPIRGTDLPYGSDTSWDVITRFLRSKLSPVVGGLVDAAQGENVVGEPVTLKSAASRLMLPLSFQDIYEAMKEQGVPTGTALAMLSLFGWGLQTYQPKQDAASVVAGRQLQQAPGAAGLTPAAREAWRNYLADNLRRNAATNAAAASNLNAMAETLRQMQQRAEIRRQGVNTNLPPR